MKIARCTDGLYAIVPDNNVHYLCDAPKGLNLDDIDCVKIHKSITGKYSATLDHEKYAQKYQSKQPTIHSIEHYLVAKFKKATWLHTILLILIYHWMSHHV